jgi:hypothetical protein
MVALAIPVNVGKLLTAHKARVNFLDDADALFDRVRRTLKMPSFGKVGGVRGGCFARVLMCKGFVIKWERDMPSHPRSCSMKKDFTFIRKMRSKPSLRSHFPMSQMFGDSLMVQERCDINYNLYEKHEHRIRALGYKLGIEDVHEENIGWRKTATGEFVPVFIDVGFRTRPGRAKKVRKDKTPKWAKGLAGFMGRSESW